MNHPLLTKLKRHPRGVAAPARLSLESETSAATSPGRGASQARQSPARPSWSSLRAIAGSVSLGGNALDDVERLHDG